MELTDLERRLAAALRDDGVFDVAAAGGDKRIRGAALTHILADQKTRIASCQISGGKIEGPFKLSPVAAGADTPLTLVFRNCHFTDAVTLDHGSFSRLSFEDCRVSHLSACSARVIGDVDLSGLASAQPDNARTGCVRGAGEDAIAQGLCFVDLEGIVVGGQVKASRAHLCCRPREASFDGSAGGRPYALRLVNARIGGSLVLQPAFVATGGVVITHARIDGTVWLQGAQLSAEWGNALDFTSSHIRGSIAISAVDRDTFAEPFSSDGQILLYTTEVDGELYMQGAQLAARTDAQEAALIVYRSTINSAVRCSAFVDAKQRYSSIPFEARGRIGFDHSHLGGLEMQGTAIDGQGYAALSLSGATIRGELQIHSASGLTTAKDIGNAGAGAGPRPLLHPALIIGGLTAGDVTVEGGVDFQGVRLENGGADFTQARIQKSLAMGAFRGGLQQTRKTVIEGELRMVGATIGGQLQLRDMRLGMGLAASGAKIARDVSIIDVESANALWLRDAEIGGNLHVQRTRIDTDKDCAFEISQAKISGGFWAVELEANQQLRGRHLVVAGPASIGGVFRGASWSLDLDNSSIGGDFQLELSADARTSLQWMSVAKQTRLKVRMIGNAGSAPTLQMKGAQFNGGLELRDNAVSFTNAIVANSFIEHRITPLKFYEGWYVVESISATERAGGVASFLWDGQGECLVLTGASSVIHDFHARKPSPLRLRRDNVLQYLEFFSANVWDTKGAFKILIEQQDLPERNRMKPEIADTTDGWSAHVIVRYANQLYRARFTISHNGYVAMVEEEALGLSLAGPRYARPLRSMEALNRHGLAIMRGLDPKRAWPVEIWSPGQWVDLADQPARAALAVSSLQSYRLNQRMLFEAMPFRRVRVRELECYPGWLLAQGLIDLADNQAMIAWLWNGSDKGHLLTGKSNAIYDFHAERPPLLKTPEQIESYLRLFCNHVWADGGAFLIVDDGEQLPFAPEARDDRAGAIRPLRIKQTQGAQSVAETTICYQGAMFHADFVIFPGGYVEMIKEEPLNFPQLAMTTVFDTATALVSPLPKLPPPSAQSSDVAWPDAPSFTGAWAPLNAARLKSFLSAFSNAHDQQHVVVDLSAARTLVLEDRGGKAWGERARLSLGGFNYEHVDRGLLLDERQLNPYSANADLEPPPSGLARARDRMLWLRKQFPGKRPRTLREFDSQPHAQLAAAYRRAGDTDEARAITKDKLRLEAELRAREFRRALIRHWLTYATLALGAICAVASLAVPSLAWLAAALIIAPALIWASPTALDRVFRYGFGYGLEPRSALLTFTACLFIGWMATTAANRGQIGVVDFSGLPQILVLNVTSVSDVLVAENAGDRFGVRLSSVQDASTADIACGDHIEPFVYAADVFIPLVDLRQEGACKPSSGVPFASLWQWIKGLYACLGWIVTSMTILTVSGVLRSRLE
ncbi:hypothetical protein [Terricaulis sp.]|uniref:hypothetical protein n=1 Tax=Terricaulis sp. TaxID=2768686 RepID=UPI002AC409A9|nr:hypothetical protein [Terricaulis sp.]MDZ4690031.1 hypothetical protein [Terricaulis sp.]